MRTFTTTTTVYTFDELSDDAKQKALEDNSEINVEYWEWWDSIEGDANEIGLDITEFDTDRQTIGGKLTDDLQGVCKAILANHGKNCDTYKLAEQWQHKHGEDNEQEFLKALLGEYLQMLIQEYEFCTSDESIADTLIANEYEFTKEGVMV